MRPHCRTDALYCCLPVIDWAFLVGLISTVRLFHRMSRHRIQTYVQQWRRGRLTDSDDTATATWADLAAAPAGPTAVTALAAVDAAALSGADLVDAIVCSEKAVSLLLGVQARLMAALAVPFVAGDPMRLAGKLARRSGLTDGDDYHEQRRRPMVAEAARSRWPPGRSPPRCGSRRSPPVSGSATRPALTEEFTPARQALEDGILDRGKLRAIVEQVQVLPADKIGPVLDQVLPAAADRCTSEIREIAAQAVITADPDGAADRHRQAADRREVEAHPRQRRDGHPQGVPARRRRGQDLPGQRPAGHRHRRRTR